jgi:hypothetical protein
MPARIARWAAVLCLCAVAAFTAFGQVGQGFYKNRQIRMIISTRPA